MVNRVLIVVHRGIKRKAPCEVGTHGYDVLSFALKRFLRSVEFIFGCFSTFAVIYNLNLKFFGDRIVKDAISI